MELRLAVSEVNTAPDLAPITNRTVNAGSLLTVPNGTTDADLPAQTMSYSLVTAPTGATVGASTRTFTWTPTSEQVSNHTVSIRVTDNGTPALTDTETFTVTVNAASQPDLVLTALSTTTTVIRPGTTLSASSTARNQGTLASGSFVVAFRLSPDPVYGGTNDIVVAATRSISSLAINTNSTGSTTLTVPASTPLGPYYLCATADGNSTVTESDETNNSRCTTATISVDAPDLTMTALQPQATTVGRFDRFGVLNTVANIAPVAAPGSTVSFRLSTNTVVGDGDDIMMNLTRNAGSLAANASSTATTQPRVPLTTPLGFYYVCATADSGGAVAERNESNNSLCSATTIQVVQ